MRKYSLLRPLVASISLVAFLLVVGVFSAPKADAAISDAAKCLDGAGELNAVLFVRFRDSAGGAVLGYSNHFAFGVTAVTESSYETATSDAGVSMYSGAYNGNTIVRFQNNNVSAYGPAQTFTAQRVGTSIASGQGNLCDPDNNAGNKVLAYAFRSGDGTAYFPGLGQPAVDYDNNGSMSLSCINNTDVGFKFNFGGIADIPAGYTVTSTAVTGNPSAGIGLRGSKSADASVGYIFSKGDQAGDTVNHDQIRIYYDVYLSPPPVLTPHAGLSGGNSGEVEAGDVVTPTASITRSGSGDPTVTWTWWFWYDQDLDGSYDTGEQIAGGRTTPLTGSSNAYPAALTGYSGAAVPPDKRSICSRLLLTSTTAGSYSPPDGDSKATCYTIVRRPYFRIMNGDANATGVVQDANGVCSGAVSSTIQAFNKGAGAAFKGAGADVAVFATGSVKEFVSAALVDTIRPKGLTFSNTAGDATYGGGFGQTYCIPNYWASPTATAPYTATATTGSVVVDGDVFVTGSPDTASFALNDIPLRWVVASGNIYISKDVENLAGNYVAKGKIYTCATGAGAQVPQASMITDCSKPLTVNGTFIAGSGVVFQRTAGSLNGDPAERIIYTPEIWLQSFRPQAGAPNNVRYNGKFDSIIMLPPVL